MSIQKNTGEPGKKKGSSLEKLEIGNAVYLTRLTSKFINRKKWQRPDLHKVRALIPGTIQKILISEGDQVSAGSPLLILEAMKMRNEVRSPVQGIIKKIHVTEGEQVPKDHLLVEFS